MNKNNILKKLEIFLQNHTKFKEECEIVYFLAEIRKLIEDDKKDYKTLYFYCCWVLHSSLYYDSVAEFLSDEFDKYIDLQKKKSEIQKDLMEGKEDFFKLRDLNDQLRKFRGLTINFLDGNAWYKFCQLFLDNFTECEIDISIVSQRSHPHKINKLTVEKTDQNYFYKFYLTNGVRVPSIILKYKLFS